MPDETFLPDTTLKAYSYRGAYGQPVRGPWNDSMRPGIPMGGLGRAPAEQASAPKTVLLSFGLACFGLYAAKQAMRTDEKRAASEEAAFAWGIASLVSFMGAFGAQLAIPLVGEAGTSQ